MSDFHDDSKSAPHARKILLVEDSFANRDMLTRRLQRRGFTVCSAPDGSTGVAMSVSEKPDLILMDVALGEMDGWQATRLIKADARTLNIPIIALTAHALASDREKSIEVGCADFDTKPVDLTRLLGKIQGCLARPTFGQAQSHRHAYVARQEYGKEWGVMSTNETVQALTGSMRDFRELQGTNLMARVGPFYEWQEVRRKGRLWPYSKSTQKAPLSVCTAVDESGVKFTGLNFGTQDYLGLSSDPEIKEVAKAVIDEYGVHSAGSSALAGNTKYSLRLEETISQFLNLDHTVLYPTGWAAGYGVIRQYRI